MLRLLPPQVKLYAELAAALAICALIMWGIHHLREQGREEVRAADMRAEQAAIIHKSEVEALARARAGVIVNELQASLVAPPPDDALTVRVCRPTDSPDNDMSTNAVTGQTAHEETGLSAGVAGHDIGPSTEQLLVRANAQVKALQSYIAACQEAGICEK